MKNILIAALFILTTSFAESNIANEYTNSTPSSDRAKRAVEFFLTTPDLEEFRIETGTQNLLTTQIQHVTNAQVCSQLNALVEANPGLQSNKEGYTLYFYKAGDFYFIFHRIEKVRLGYSDFNVISSDFKVLGMYMI